MNIARISDSLVINIEVADADWVGLNDSSDVVPYQNDNPAHIGLAWSLVDGFEQPVLPPPVEVWAS